MRKVAGHRFNAQKSAYGFGLWTNNEFAEKKSTKRPCTITLKQNPEINIRSKKIFTRKELKTQRNGWNNILEEREITCMHRSTEPILWKWWTHTQYFTSNYTTDPQEQRP